MLCSSRPRPLNLLVYLCFSSHVRNQSAPGHENRFVPSESWLLARGRRGRGSGRLLPASPSSLCCYLRRHLQGSRQFSSVSAFVSFQCSSRSLSLVLFSFYTFLLTLIQLTPLLPQTFNPAINKTSKLAPPPTLFSLPILQSVISPFRGIGSWQPELDLSSYYPELRPLPFPLSLRLSLLHDMHFLTPQAR
ncbi:hypothetical protein GGS23DRAFT_314254 [Durotheca rogersii]|uniref:uncharacterized protein n=1 Tax=Durotheca rogersii TaxID=419775 RepID=UPI00221F60F6|nr:uncharacterized protein GGS23DRAFT_314254 [Durotheca rogersii]KAI5859584.1 hypothetical protein GGS23DRAFT_314254 [Durotheca rogersii]